MSEAKSLGIGGAVLFVSVSCATSPRPFDEADLKKICAEVDANVHGVNFEEVVPTTVDELSGMLPPPEQDGRSFHVPGPSNKKVYEVEANVVSYSEDRNADLTVTIAGDSGRTIPLVLPLYLCKRGKQVSPAVAQKIADARTALMAMLGKPESVERRPPQPLKLKVAGVGTFSRRSGMETVKLPSLNLYPVVSVERLAP